MLKKISWKELKVYDWQLVYYEKKVLADGTSEGKFHISTAGIVIFFACIALLTIALW